MSETVERAARVTVVIPTKDRRELLREALASVRAQSVASHEVLVCDDGSEDGTREMVAGLASVDARVRWLPRGPLLRPGAAARRNDGLAAARGECVVFLDSDDLLSPRALEERLARLDDDPRLDFVAFAGAFFEREPGDGDLLWNDLTPERRDDLDRFLRGDTPWHTTGPMWRRESLLSLGGWDESAPSWQDWEFHIRALAKEPRYAKIEIVDHFIRRDGETRISAGDARADRLLRLGDLLLAVRDDLRRAGRMTPERHAMLRGVFCVWLGAILHRSGDPAAVHRLISKGSRGGLFGPIRVANLHFFARLARSPVRAVRYLGWRGFAKLAVEGRRVDRLNLRGRPGRRQIQAAVRAWRNAEDGRSLSLPEARPGRRHA